MSKLKSELLALAGIAAMGASEYFGTPRRTSPFPVQHREPPRIDKVDLSEREFIIKGEKIRAHDKKTAIKIYNRRHNIKKKKK